MAASYVRASVLLSLLYQKEVAISSYDPGAPGQAAPATTAAATSSRASLAGTEAVVAAALAPSPHRTDVRRTAPSRC
eukprot:6197309-Pleurochrysis_carterae.AAC.3